MSYHAVRVKHAAWSQEDSLAAHNLTLVAAHLYMAGAIDAGVLFSLLDHLTARCGHETAANPVDSVRWQWMGARSELRALRAQLAPSSLKLCHRAAYVQNREHIKQPIEAAALLVC